MNQRIEELILSATRASHVQRGEVIQSLWSGYGEVVRFALQGCELPSVVVKHIRFPNTQNHPRGWNTGRSHVRKVKSYQVEMAWYADFSQRCDSQCRVPQCYASDTFGDEHILVLEDLDAAGFAIRRSCLGKKEAKLGLRWLAHLHATFLAEAGHDLWQEGSYWHLATRPDELVAMQSGELKQHAHAIAEQLQATSYQTLIHGDAKVANFCFSDDGASLAAVDFQYIGGGCGMKDVAYFLGSCLDDGQLRAWQDELLNAYFATFTAAVNQKHSHINTHALEQEWRALYPVAWADFYRFLAGWMPTHAKINGYGQGLTDKVLKQLSLKACIVGCK